MNRARTIAARRGCAAAALLAVLIGVVAPLAAARASTITEISASYTVGTAGATEIESFTVAGPGTAEVTLTDLLWPQALASLSFELTNAAGQVVGTLSGAGSATFDLAAGGTYFALSYGQASSGPSAACPFGTYGVSIAYTPPTPVPLPAGLVLLASGLGLLLVLGRGVRAVAPVAAINV